MRYSGNSELTGYNEQNPAITNYATFKHVNFLFAQTQTPSKYESLIRNNDVNKQTIYFRRLLDSFESFLFTSRMGE